MTVEGPMPAAPASPAKKAPDPEVMATSTPRRRAIDGQAEEKIWMLPP